MAIERTLPRVFEAVLSRINHDNPGLSRDARRVCEGLIGEDIIVPNNEFGDKVIQRHFLRVLHAERIIEFAYNCRRALDLPPPAYDGTPNGHLLRMREGEKRVKQAEEATFWLGIRAQQLGIEGPEILVRSVLAITDSLISLKE